MFMRVCACASACARVRVCPHVRARGRADGRANGRVGVRADRRVGGGRPTVRADGWTGERALGRTEKLQTLCSFTSRFPLYFIYESEVTNPMLCSFSSRFL